ncbi:unnamed protein product [Sphagnum troendelagicum]|uniref:Protein ENHANCED DISEASE RESISTANCE 2 C-terminal domain-containing protein n=1 Tax=Sphagnum troendelagicum TaxID=128251 RepID=A0ABP0TDN1_9BRYO
MGHCCSTGRKPRRKASRVSAAKFRKGSAKLVIPVSGLNLTDATHLFELGSNVQLGGSVSAFVMEKDSRHMIAVGSKTNANRSPREAFSRTQSLAKGETWFDAQEEVEASEDYASGNETFSTDENLSATSTRSRSPILSQRPSYAALKDEMAESMTEQSERPMGAQGDHGDSHDITTSSLEATDSLSDPRWIGVTTHSEFLVERPIGGTQIPRCSSEKPVDGCWSFVSPSVFSLRAESFLRDRKKVPAPDLAIFEPCGADLFLSSKKIDHVAQFVELPFQGLAKGPDSIPNLLIMNLQLPLYSPTVFLPEIDGDGLNLVLYFKLTEALEKEIPPYLSTLLKRFLDDDVDKVKSFAMTSTTPFRDRLKVILHLVNPSDVQLSVAEENLVASYNEKPVLSRPQHEFYRGGNYFEIDVDMHRFSYLARKGFDMFRERFKDCTVDFGFTIQANKAEELPEHMLGGIRLNKVDFGNVKELVTGDSESGLPFMGST